MVTPCERKHLLSQKDFDQVMKADIPVHEIPKLSEGDLILRIIKGTVSPSYHAGVYCGNEEVISFTAPSNTRWYEKIPRLLLPEQSANVIKESVTNFLSGKSYEVLRLKSSIPEDFSNSVKTAMKYNEEYNHRTNNCLHFALRLLKLPAEPLPERKSGCDDEARATGSQKQTPDQPLVETSPVTLPSTSHQPNTPQSTDDVVKNPPVKPEEGQPLLKPKTSESTTNKHDEMADVKKPPVKTEAED